MIYSPVCKDCRAEGVRTRRKLATNPDGSLRPGPRCVTHVRAVTKARRERAKDLRVEAIHDAIDGALASASLSRGRIAAIGVGAPGPIDPERGLILRSPNIAARQVFLGPRIEKEFSRPVRWRRL